MTEILEALQRIERQNLQILATLAPKPSKKYLTVEDAATRLDRSTWTLRQLCATGLIPAAKGADGCWRIPAEEVDRLEAAGVPKLPKR
jgi:hypothetical protein